MDSASSDLPSENQADSQTVQSVELAAAVAVVVVDTGPAVAVGGRDDVAGVVGVWGRPGTESGGEGCSNLRGTEGESRVSWAPS